jgi:superfamily II DNA helicase RecQ
LTWQYLINTSAEQKSTPDEIKQSRINELRNVIQFAINKSSCRRKQVLQFFGQKFDASNCQNKCDNCMHRHKLVEKDLTDQARAAVELVKWWQKQYPDDNITIATCRNLYRRVKNAATQAKKIDQCPENLLAGKYIDQELVELLFDRLLVDDILALISLKSSTSSKHYDYVTVSVVCLCTYLGTVLEQCVAAGTRGWALP